MAGGMAKQSHLSGANDVKKVSRVSTRARCRLHHISRSRHHGGLARSVDQSSVSALVLEEPGPDSGDPRMPGNYVEHLAI